MSFEESRVGIRALLPLALLRKCAEVQDRTGTSRSRLLKKTLAEHLTQRADNAKDKL